MTKNRPLTGNRMAGMMLICLASGALYAAPGNAPVKGAMAAGMAVPAPVAPTYTPPPAEPLPPGVAPLSPDVDAAPEALLVDLGSGRTLYARDPDRRFVPASVTKTMTAYLAFHLMAQGKLRPDQIFTESDDAYRHWHATGSRMFLNARHPVTVDQLLTGIMTVSANDGCIVLAEGAAGSTEKWVAMMNAEARALGMTGSHFGTPNGWMDGGNTYYTPRDLVKLADAMITRYPAYYHRYVGQASMTFNGITQSNHDPILDVQGADGIKTGFTNEAHYTFLGSAMRDGRRLVMVLAGVPTAKQRARAARALIEWGFAAWDTHPLLAAGVPVGTVAVDGGMATEVPVVTPRAYGVTVPKGARPAVTMHFIPRGSLVAPVTRGQEVGNLEVHVAGEAPYYVPLVAGANVAAGTMMQRLLARVKGAL